MSYGYFAIYPNPSEEMLKSGNFTCTICNVNKQTTDDVSCYYTDIGDKNQTDYGYSDEDTIVYLCNTCCTDYNLFEWTYLILDEQTINSKNYNHYNGFHKMEDSFYNWFDQCNKVLPKIKKLCKVSRNNEYTQFICNNCNNQLEILNGLHIYNNKNLYTNCFQTEQHIENEIEDTTNAE